MVVVLVKGVERSKKFQPSAHLAYRHTETSLVRNLQDLEMTDLVRLPGNEMRLWKSCLVVSR